MKKLIFVFAVLFSTSFISCNKHVESSSEQDSTVVDSDSINTDSVVVCED